MGLIAMHCGMGVLLLVAARADTRGSIAAERYLGVLDASSLLQDPPAPPPSDPYAPAPPLSDPYAAWVHVPGTGATFGITLAYHANPSLPATARAVADESAVAPQMFQRSAGSAEMSAAISAFQGFYSEVWETTPIGLAGQNLKLRTAVHRRIDPKTYAHFKGHFCGMFREPSARLRSTWHTFAPGSDPQEYARRTVGVATKMLAGQADGAECSKPDAPCRTNAAPNTDLALERLKGFKFIGLTEQWALSVCLFHRMFGGQCRPDEFRKLKPGGHPGGGAGDRFGEFVDPYDTALYAEAREIFWTNVRNYQLTQETCRREVCPGAAYEITADPSFPGL